MRPLATSLLLALTILCSIVARPAMAITPEEEDAKAFAMEVAAPYVKKGFRIRAEDWTGKVASGKKKAVKQQLFKGNEYWFWLGVNDEDAKIQMKVYDSEGKSVEVQRVSKDGMAAARIVPEKTASYIVVFIAKSKRSETVTWALHYGYK